MPLDFEPLPMQMIDNYIYMYHVDTFLVLPSFADSVTDTMNANFETTNPLSRSAPIYSYTGSGPRQIQVQFTFHRDMLNDLNYGVSNALLDFGDDYVDTLIKNIQAAVLPTYDAATSMVSPPIIALRLGNDIFIKGVISGSLALTYHYPILDDGKYSHIDIGFTVYEIDPYDAYTVMKTGSYRGLSTTLERKILSGGSNSPFTGDMRYGTATVNNVINNITSNDYDTLAALYNAFPDMVSQQQTSNTIKNSINNRSAEDNLAARQGREVLKKQLDAAHKEIKATRETKALAEWQAAIEQGKSIRRVGNSWVIGS